MKIKGLFGSTLKKKATLKLMEILIDALIEYKEIYKRKIMSQDNNINDIQNHF